MGLGRSLFEPPVGYPSVVEGVDNLLLENGDDLLLEDAVSNLLLEDS